MGLHDALDGFITFREVQHARSKMRPEAQMPDLTSDIGALSCLCRNRDWTTDDPLGIGGLLFDADRLSHLRGDEADQELLRQLTDACQKSLRDLLATRLFSRPTSQRLAFRELGLAIGLNAVPTITGRTDSTSDRYPFLADKIVNAWLAVAHSPDELWQAHRDINDVMLATALTPQTFMSVDERRR